jgi:hypothetical protein
LYLFLVCVWVFFIGGVLVIYLFRDKAARKMKWRA